MENIIHQKALDLGFEGCGIIPVSELEEYADRLRDRLDMFPDTKPMLEPLNKYARPDCAFENAKSVIVCTSSYSRYSVPASLQGLIAKYYLFDHKLQPDTPVYKRITEFENFLEENCLAVGKALHGVTSGRLAAHKTGLGIIRKNNFLYTSKSGSHVIIDTWTIDRELELKHNCRLSPCPPGCNLCIKACPTQSLCEPYCMKMTSCITHLTWGAKSLHDESTREKMGSWLYGCDVCQDACPYSHGPGTQDCPDLNAFADSFSPIKLLDMNNEQATALLAKRFWFITPDRIWLWKANILRMMANRYKEEYRHSILKSIDHPDERINETARWAASQCGLK